MHSKRAAALLLFTMTASACAGDAFLGPAAPQDHAALFDQIWTEFDRHYSFFELKHIDWRAAKIEYRPRAVAASSDAEFAGVVSEMLGTLNDVHVSLTPTPAAGAPTTLRFVSQREVAPVHFSARRVFENYVKEMDTSADAHVRYGHASPDVGYLYIPTFSGNDWSNAVDSALRALHGVSSLIIDVRNNHGGNNTLAVHVAGRFADRERLYGYVRIRNGPAHGDFTDYIAESVRPAGAARFGGDVVVLANSHTVSSAEDFVLAMRALPQVTVVGDTTAGASGSPMVRELPNGWTYQLSEWIEYTPDRQSFEGRGLAPMVTVVPTAADAERSRDPAFEMALRLLRPR